MATLHIRSFVPVVSQDLSDGHRDLRGPQSWPLPVYLVPGLGGGCSMSSAPE